MNIEQCSNKYKILYPTLKDYQSDWSYMNRYLNDADDIALVWQSLRDLRALLDGAFKSKVTETVTGEVYVLLSFDELKQWMLGLRDLLKLHVH